jgi:transposase InsO family protein
MVELLLIERIEVDGWRVADAANSAGVSQRTAYKWLSRCRAGVARALHDRKPTPACCPHRLPPERIAAIERLRRQWMSGPAIARELGLSRSTVGAVLRRLGRLANLDPKPTVIRYERDHPGELVHIDTKKLARIASIGHRITGDRTGQSRNRGIGGSICTLPSMTHPGSPTPRSSPTNAKKSACAFLTRTLAFFQAHGVSVARLMTDNGSAYRSHAFKALLAKARCQHIRTKPYTPRTNGKAERFIQTSLRNWAYRNPYQTSVERAQAMQPWINAYNHNPQLSADTRPSPN